jgi:hypothetical protein
VNIFGVHAATGIAIQSKMRDLLLVGRCEQKDDARSPLNILLLAAHSVNWFWYSEPTQLDIVKVGVGVRFEH